MRTKEEIIAAAFAHVYTDIEELIKVQAKEHTVANMGQSLKDAFGRGWGVDYFDKHPERLVEMAFSMVHQDCEDDEMADGIQDEYRSWLKDSRRDALAVQKKGLPLTLESTRLAFEKKGPFEKKVRAKKGV